MNKKILLIYNIAAPYRVEFLNELSKYKDILVIFENSTSKHRNKDWLANEDIKFEHIFVDKNIKNWIISIYYLIKHKNVVMGGYATPYSMLMILLMKLFRKSFTLNADGGFIKNERLLNKKIKKFFIGSAKYWLSTGKKTNEYLEYYGATENNIFVYPFSSIFSNEVDKISELEKRNLKLKYSISSNRNVLYIGSFIRRKGYYKLIEAAKINQDINYYLVGGTPNSIEIEYTKEINNIKFINHVSKEEVIKYLDMCDLFVFPTNEDIWGLVINESLARGVPTITTDMCIAGLEMITNDSIGKILPVSTTGTEYAKIIEEELYSYDKFDSNQIINKAKNYTLETMVKKHIEIFEIIMK